MGLTAPLRADLLETVTDFSFRREPESQRVFTSFAGPFDGPTDLPDSAIGILRSQNRLHQNVICQGFDTVFRNISGGILLTSDYLDLGIAVHLEQFPPNLFGRH